MSKEDGTTEVLRSCSVFKDLSEKELENIARTLTLETVSAGKMLMDVSAPADKVYLIERGKVKITRVTSYGEETTLNVLGRGDLVGELSVLDDSTRSARATCVEDTHTYSMPQKEFQKILDVYPSTAINLARELGKRIRAANDVIMRRLEEHYQTSESRVGRLQRLMEASKLINSTLDLEKLLGLILEAATKSLNVDRGTVYLIDEFKKELWSKVLQGSDMAEIRLPFGKGISGYVAQTGETINIPDVYKDPRFNPETDKKSGYRTTNMLCMPMRNKDRKTIGVFQLMNKKEGPFDSMDEQFIAALSTHASIAVENARLAQEMVQNERLSAVGRMASTIIHDIKNPMGTIRVYAQVMKKKSGNEEAAKLADEMIHQIDRFVNMTQEILDFTRGVSSMNIQEVDFGEVMNAVLDFIEKDLNKNNVQLVRNAQFQGKVKLDQDKMVRVFYNIASNARDAMPQGGSLTVTTKPADTYVTIEFLDSGTGMPEEVKKRIFEPFVTFGKKHGTGLGMAIVKKVIDDHKGKIEIDSEMGKGTTIRIMLPTS